MFQKDYWSMDDDRLAQEAVKYHVKIEDYVVDQVSGFSDRIFPRDYIIATLVGRDQALRTRWITAISIISLLISLAAFLLSLRK
jgi:hypothetical protein